MKNLIKSLVLLCLLLSFKSQAYTLVSFDERFDWKRPTDLFIVGYGNEAGNLFINTAVARARKQLDTFGRDRQVLIIWAKEKDSSRDSRHVSRLGLNVLYSSDDELSMEMSVAWAERLKTITSLHLVGHSTAWAGSILQYKVYFNEDPKILGRLKKKFTEDAFIFLHGCNSGFVSAPALSALFEVPVFGSLTSTDFQKLHQDGDWYFNNKGQYPAEGGWKQVNDLSFLNPKDCSGEACIRLKANNHPYRGTWGRYETGLPFHKAFCNYDLNRRIGFSRKRGIDTCYAGIWNALKTWPSLEVLNERSSVGEFNQVMDDYFCQKFDGRTIDQGCKRVVDAARRGQVSTEKFFWGEQLKCTLQNCAWKAKKVPSEEYGEVTVFYGEDAGNMTLVNELDLYRKVFDHFSR